jgi:putative endonuclease
MHGDWRISQAEIGLAFYVYILASKRNGTLYIGSTDDIARRMIEHKGHTLRGFTAKYDVTHLVWFEEHESRESAFTREPRMKVWKRAWKIALIEAIQSGLAGPLQRVWLNKTPGSWMASLLARPPG